MIYHYCDTAAFMNIMRTESIRCSSSLFMNDKLDCKVLDDDIRKWIDGNDDLSANFKKRLREMFFSTRYEFIPFVGCFSHGRDLLSQWREYADGGRGVCIGFDENEVQRHIADLNSYHKSEGLDTELLAKKVNYSDRRLTRSIQSRLDKLQSLGATMNERHKKIIREIKTETAFFKPKEFKEEDEFRLVLMTKKQAIASGDRGEVSVDFRHAADGSIVPFYEVKFPKPKEIITGPKNPSDREHMYLFVNNFHSDRELSWRKIGASCFCTSSLTLK